MAPRNAGLFSKTNKQIPKLLPRYEGCPYTRLPRYAGFHSEQAFALSAPYAKSILAPQTLLLNSEFSSKRPNFSHPKSRRHTGWHVLRVPKAGTGSTVCVYLCLYFQNSLKNWKTRRADFLACGDIFGMARRN